MSDLSGFPYFEVEFNRDGKSFKPGQVEALIDYITKNRPSDLFVISHGWNNDMNEARNLYAGVFDHMRGVMDKQVVDGLSQRKFAIMTILWPSHKFAERKLIPGGAASAGSSINNDFLRQELESMKEVFDMEMERNALDEAIALVPKLEDGKKAREEFTDQLRQLLPSTITPDVDAAEKFSSISGEVLFESLKKPLPITLLQPGATGGAAVASGSVANGVGGAAGMGNFLGGIKVGAAHVLNLITYYTMKERSGIVGSTGVNDILRTLRDKFTSLKLHLVGHSFGGRLVTSAVAGSEGHPGAQVNSMTLLQAAFSHYGFSEKYDGAEDGFFRKVVTKKLVAGPILISCTQNDKAVGLAYHLASRLAGQVAAGLGDKNDKYGGIGRNGAQKTPEAIDLTLLTVGGEYHFATNCVYNLISDAVISHHSDLAQDEVAYAILSAVAVT